MVAAVVSTYRTPLIFTAMHFKTHWRILIYLALLSLFAWLIFIWRIELANGVVPWLKLVCSLFERRYDITEFNLRQNKLEWVFHLRLMSAGAVELYGNRLPILDISATTLVTHYLLHVFIFGSALLAGAMFFKLKWPVLMPALIIAFLVSTGIDIPLTLLGSIEGLILQTLAPEQLRDSFLVKMEQALNNGGRMGLALGLSGLCLVLAMERRG